MTAPKANNRRGLLFSILFGTFLGLAFVKFGNPVILDKLMARPTNPLEWIIDSWPVSVSFIMLAVLLVVGALTARAHSQAATTPVSRNIPRWLLLLPLVWLVWQGFATAHSVNADLSHITLFQFAACVLCFYLGVFALGPSPVQPLLWLLTAALFVVITAGWYQRFGGLEETRRYFFAYIYPTTPNIPPEYLKKISSNRIFSTLFYPNALAGALLLLLPLAVTLTAQIGVALTIATRRVLVGIVVISGLACMVWSGSKAGWLLMLLLAFVALLRLDFDRKWKLRLLALVVVVGLAGFGLRYAGYFKRGATSAAARADYWHAAAQTAFANPIFGTGPGTFGIPYLKIKKPESEMARLVHNDYLEQASDSGFVGCIAYTAFIFGAVWLTFRRIWPGKDWLRFSVWLGLFGWALQGFTEFGLYIPALGWTAFALLGWLLASGNGLDSPGKPPYPPRQR